MSAISSNSKPFHFLIDEVSPEIRDAVTQMNQFGTSRPDFIRYLAPNAVHAITHNLGTALRYANDRDASVRIAAVLTLSCRWPTDPGAIRKCIATAFHDSTRQVRAFAWMAIGDMWPQSKSRADFTAMCVEPLIEKFTLARSVELPLIVHVWLDAVTHILMRARFSVRHTEQLADFEARLGQTLDVTLTRLGGDDLELMKRHLDVAYQFLTHPNPDRRSAALLILRDSNLRDFATLAAVKNIVRNEKNSEVLMNAISCLIGLLEGVYDPDAVRILSEIVREERNDPKARELAYEGLHVFVGTPVDEWPTIRKLHGCFCFPQDIDWEFVDRYRNGKCDGDGNEQGRSKRGRS